MRPDSRILLVRHPETEANVDGRYVGRGDAPLTSTGRIQAQRLVAEISRFGPDAVWTSPLPRALDVASAAAERTHAGLRVDDRLTELDFGIAEGLTYDETQARGITFAFRSEDAPVAPGGESRRDILLRTADALTEIRAQSSSPAVVTHGGVFRSAMVELLGLPLEHIWTFHIRNAQIAEIVFSGESAMLERFLQA
jgi:broad specificity phosphatase PhoE